MKVLDTLIAARNKIKRPENWTRGTIARDEYGHPVNAWSRKARSWCANGAIIATDAPIDTIERCLRRIEDEMDENITSFNDHNDHGTVLAVFDKAIAKVKRKK